jgi:hypothetical protein
MSQANPPAKSLGLMFRTSTSASSMLEYEPQSPPRPLRFPKKLCELGDLGGKFPNNT